MTARALVAMLWLACAAVGAWAAGPRGRTDSGQFTIYCDDAPLRRQVAGSAAQTKSEVLALLEEPDSWKRPIVVSVDLTPPLPGQPAVKLDVVATDVGMRIEIVARVGDQPEDINLQKQITRAVLLELMYRREGIAAGASYVEPPWWLVEGALEMLRRRESGVEPRFFRTLIETNKLPPIESFLRDKPDELGPTALAVDRALALALVQLLIEQPNGRGRLASLLRRWPSAGGDSVGALAAEFPALGGGPTALQKWWTLNLARFAANDRTLALSAEDSDRELAALLSFEIRDKAGVTQQFGIADFARFVKLPASSGVMKLQQAAIVTLSTRSNALLRPVLQEYAECFGLLARGKTRGLSERLERAAKLRAAVVKRGSDIADYLNWFEATQFGTRSNAFDRYLKTAEEAERQLREHRDPIARYLDEMEKQF